MRVLAFSSQGKIGSIEQRRFAEAGTQTPSEQGAALDRNGLSVSTETACRFQPKSPVGNSEICNELAQGAANHVISARRKTVPVFAIQQKAMLCGGPGRSARAQGARGEQLLLHTGGVGGRESNPP